VSKAAFEQCSLNCSTLAEALYHDAHQAEKFDYEKIRHLPFLTYDLIVLNVVLTERFFTDYFNCQQQSC
jgi:hypothetical protein